MGIKPIYINDLNEDLLTRLTLYLASGFPISDSLTWRLRLNLWWYANPYISEDIPVGWMITDDDSNDIHGFMGNIKSVYENRNGLKLSASCGTSWYVSDEARGPLGSSIYLTFARQKTADIMINTTPSVVVQEMLPLMGFKKIGSDKLTNYLSICSLKHTFMFVSSLLEHFSGAQSGVKKRLFIAGASIGKFIGFCIPEINKKNVQILSNDTHELQICKDTPSFIRYLQLHKKRDTIEISKDETTLNWIFFSPEVQSLLHRKIIQIFTKKGDYCGYAIYDMQNIGKDKVLRIRELQLIKPDDKIIKLILKHVKIEAKNNGCAAVYSGLQCPDSEINRLLHKNIFLHLKTENRYYVKFSKNAITDIDPYSIYVPSDLDPDVGFL